MFNTQIFLSGILKYGLVIEWNSTKTFFKNPTLWARPDEELKQKVPHNTLGFMKCVLYLEKQNPLSLNH